MNRTLLILLAVLLAFFGMADSWYLYQSAMTDTALSCDIGAGLDGCNLVAQSPYSRIFEVPLALYGAAFFSVVFAVSAALLAFPSRSLYRLFFILAAIGSIASIGFLLIQFVLIRALCIYCVLSAVAVFFLLWISHELKKRFAPLRVIPAM